MLSLFCVPVCVLAQLTLSTMHAAAILVKKRYLIGFIGGNSLRFQTTTSESDPGGDLRAMRHSVEKKPVVVVVNTERPVTNFRKDAMGEVNTDCAFDLPHQVGSGPEPTDLAAHGRVECFVKIVAGAQPDGSNQ
jgi:hypothetical protein